MSIETTNAETFNQLRMENEGKSFENFADFVHAKLCQELKFTSNFTVSVTALAK